MLCYSEADHAPGDGGLDDGFQVVPGVAGAELPRVTVH